MRGGGEGRARVQERREGKRERAGGELLDRAADVASIQSLLSGDVGPAAAVAADSQSDLSKKNGRQVARGGRVGPCRTCDGVGHGSLSEVSGPTRGTWRPRRPMSDVRRRRGRPRCRRWRADTSDVAVASAQVGRATAAEAAARSEVSGQQVGRGVRVGPCRTCDGGGGGSAVGRGGPARRAASAFARAAEKHVANRQGRT